MGVFSLEEEQENKRMRRSKENNPGSIAAPNGKSQLSYDQS